MLKTSYKRLIGLLFCLTPILLCGQIKNEWLHLGPFQTPISTVDSGMMSSTGMGWIESLWVSDDGKTLYAGSITAGVFKSTDGGANWDLLPFNKLQYGALDLMIEGPKVWVATGLTHYDTELGNGIIVSTDEGKNWNDTIIGLDEPSWAITRINKRTILKATPTTIYISKDRGENWTKSYFKEDINFNFRQTLRASKKKKWCFASGSHLIMSKNKGKDWLPITHRLSVYADSSLKDAKIQRIAFCSDPNKKKRFLALYSYRGITYLDESTDGCKSFKLLYSSKTIQRVDINHAEIAIAPGNSNVIVIGAVRAYKSIDGGKSFSQMTFPYYKTPQFVHDDIRSMVLKDSLNFYLGTDGGVFKTLDGGQSWQNLNGKGLTAMMIYGLGIIDSGFAVGCQDLGTFVYRDSQWLNLGNYYGDGGDVLQVGNKVYTILRGDLRAFSTNLKPTFYRVPASRMNPFTAQLKAHPNSDTFYMISDHLFMYDGIVWQSLTSKLNNHGYKANAVDINVLNKKQLYFAFDQASWDRYNDKFFKSIDGGLSWINITEQLPILNWRYITAISSSSEDPEKVYVSLGMADQDESAVHKVYRSVDGGVNWSNWSEGLPPLQTFKIEYLKGSKSGILLSTVSGMYYRSDSTLGWEYISEDVPRIAMRDFEVDYKKKLVYVSTYGNGVWIMKLPDKMLKD